MVSEYSNDSMDEAERMAHDQSNEREREGDRPTQRRRRRRSDGRVSEEDRSGGCAGLLREVHEKAPRSSGFLHRFRRTRCCFCSLASHRPHVGLDWVGGWGLGYPSSERRFSPHGLQRERILVASLIHIHSFIHRAIYYYLSTCG